MRSECLPSMLPASFLTRAYGDLSGSRYGWHHFVLSKRSFLVKAIVASHFKVGSNRRNLAPIVLQKASPF